MGLNIDQTCKINSVSHNDVSELDFFSYLKYTGEMTETTLDIYARDNSESVCSKRNLKIKNLTNCIKFWGIVIENSVTCFSTRDNLLTRLKVHSYIFVFFAMNLGLSLLFCNKTFPCLFLLQITVKSRVNPEILYKRTFVSTVPSSLLVQSVQRRL